MAIGLSLQVLLMEEAHQDRARLDIECSVSEGHYQVALKKRSHLRPLVSKLVGETEQHTLAVRAAAVAEGYVDW